MGAKNTCGKVPVMVLLREEAAHFSDCVLTRSAAFLTVLGFLIRNAHLECSVVSNCRVLVSWQPMTFYFGFKKVEVLFAGLVINTAGGE